MINSDEHTYDELLISNVLSGEANNEEVQLFHEKYNGNDAFRHMYIEMKEMWENSHALMMVGNVDVNQAVANFMSRVDRAEEKKKRHFRIAIWVAGIAATLTISLILYTSYFANKPLEVLTNDTIVNISLSDSSKISINKNSRLTYPKVFKDSTREVFLTGEAYFTIKPDKAHAFIIHANTACIKVVGTSFNVNSKDDEVMVSVTSGNVLLYAKNDESKQIMLTKGETGSFLTKNQSMLKKVITDPNYRSWATGVFTFDRTPLREAVTVLGQYYHAKIGFTHKNLGNCRLTAVISHQSLESVLKILELTFDFTTIKKDSIILAGNGCEP